MYGYLRSLKLEPVAPGDLIQVASPETQLVKEFTSNELYRLEVDRYFRLFVTGFSPTSFDYTADMLFRGAHNHNLLTGQFMRNVYLDVANFGTSVNEFPRFRYSGQGSVGAPAAPSQIAFVMGRLFAYPDFPFVVPAAMLSSVDINLRQIGNVFGHPVGRRAWFSETLQPTVGTGFVNTGGPLVFTPSDEYHYIYDLRITATGDDTTARYVFARRPYYIGAYEPGSGEPDFISGADTPQARVDGVRSVIDQLSTLIPDSASPSPSTVPYDLNYPTPVAKAGGLSSYAPGLAFDGLEGGRMWWVALDPVTVNDPDASASRSLWAWKRMSGEAFARMDTTLTGWPVLAAGVQLRDIKAGRGGVVYVAADADDNDGNGSSSGGALMVVNAATNTVLATIGVAVAGIHTLGGFFQDNVLAIAVDTRENVAGVGFDRVWVLHRNGLSFFDVDVTSPVTVANIGARSTVSDAGATFNVLDAGSVRGVGGVYRVGVPSIGPNLHQPFLDVDSSGDVYWLSEPAPFTVQRLNHLDGGAASATFYSLDTAAEVGALGFIDIGDGYSGTSRLVSGLRVHRRDRGDPLPEDVWISTGYGGSTSTVLVRQIPIDGVAFVAVGDNPGFGFPSADFTVQATSQQWGMVVGPDGFVWVAASHFWEVALLESRSRKALASVAGATKTIAFVAGATYSLTDTTATFTAGDVGRPLFINGAVNAANNGRWLITAFISATVIRYTNAGGVAEGPSSLNWAIDYFDSDAGTGQGSQASGWATIMLSPGFVDESGLFYQWQPRSFRHSFQHYAPTAFQYPQGTAGDLIVDTSVGATGAQGPATNQVTLTADTFSSGARRGDFFRITSGPFTGTEIQILSVDSTTQATLVAAAPAFAGTTWQVRRRDWYRSRYPTTAVANSKVAHLNKEQLVMGARVGFLNGAGPAQYVVDEYYTFGATVGLLKDTTQQVTFSYDLYNEKTILISNEADKVMVNQVARVGYVDSANQIDPLTDDPFTGVGRPNANAQLQMGHYQRQLMLDGNNGTEDTSTFNTFDATTGLQYALDLGADTVASQLRFGLTGVGSTEITIALYSATAAQFAGGPPNWTLRATYRSDQDMPAWNLVTDPFHTSGSPTGLGSLMDVEVDLVALLGGGNTAQRYWKMHFLTQGSVIVGGSQMVGAVAFDTTAGPAGPLPIGITSAKYLSASIDSNYLANFPVRVVFVQDTGTGLTSSRSTTNPRVVTLAADTFGTVAPFDVAANDFFRTVRASAGGATKSISAPNTLTGAVTVTDSAGGFAQVYAGGRIRITGAANVVNNNTFLILSVIDTQNILIFNPSAVAEGPNALSWLVTSVDMKILTRDSTTQITLVADAPAFFTSQDWEVVRSADVRPRDNEGGLENLPRFPLSAGEIFLCPVTGHAFYHATDVSNARTIRFERYVKVQRSL